ncbi:MAG: HAD hydrolase-like protein [Leptolyngbyaceae cyanobacterium bins.302]|nr:HAD hydrolase-like protein [Leptolyngbyaceae cyanobacterium bins.302]
MQYQCSSSTTPISDKVTLNELIAPYPPYAGLIFDCDGTIAHTLPVHCQIWITTFRKFGAEVSEAWYYDRTGLSASELIAAFNEDFGCAINQSIIDTERQQHFLDLIDFIGNKNVLENE